jgi:phosphate transport system permease protein
MKIHWNRDGRRHLINYAMSGAALACVIIALIPLGSILWTVIQKGGPILNYGFITGAEVAPCNANSQLNCQIGGIGPAVEGTFVMLGLASLIAIPVGIGAGIFLAEYGRGRVSRTISFLMDVMSGVPSIVVGLFVFTALFYYDIPNRLHIYNAYAGALALAVIMLPIVTRTAEEALRTVPNGIREAAWALGIPHHRAVRKIVLRSAGGSLITGALLAVARAGGETAPLLFTAAWSPFFINCPPGQSALSCLDNPVGALGPLIWIWGTSPYSNEISGAWGAALFFVLIMLAISVTARIILYRRNQRVGG